MGGSICLDSDFLINLLRGKDEELVFVKEHELSSTLATTTINLFELYVGAFKQKSKKEIECIDALSESLKLLTLSPQSSKRAGRNYAFLKERGIEVEFRDVLIAAITIDAGFSIKTNNEKHFLRIPNILIEV